MTSASSMEPTHDRRAEVTVAVHSMSERDHLAVAVTALLAARPWTRFAPLRVVQLDRNPDHPRCALVAERLDEQVTALWVDTDPEPLRELQALIESIRAPKTAEASRPEISV